MKAILIGAPSSNTGKTTLSLGLARALKNRGLDLSAFKTGPDHIDLKLLEEASSKRVGNLDMHLMGEEGLAQSLAQNPGDLALIEGAMGYFDGIYNGFENSSFDISRRLGIPAVLVYRPQGEMFSAIPKIKGMVDFSQGRIRGLILNGVSEKMYQLLKEQVENYIDIEVLGYLPFSKELVLPSEGLGLSLSASSEGLISKAAELVEKTVDLDRLVGLAGELSLYKPQPVRRRNIRIALAKDEAFNFYYNENLRLLEEAGELIYFSPLKDTALPPADLIYIGGGYPENYLKELSENERMKSSIREAVESGIHLLAEAGGLTYLMEDFEGQAMVGLFKGRALMSKRLQNFGYNQLELLEDTILGEKGWRLPGNEYHRSYIEGGEPGLIRARKLGDESRQWACGYGYKRALGIFSQINFLGNRRAFDYLMDSIERTRKSVS